MFSHICCRRDLVATQLRRGATTAAAMAGTRRRMHLSRSYGFDHLAVVVGKAILYSKRSCESCVRAVDVVAPGIRPGTYRCCTWACAEPWWSKSAY